MQASLCVCGTGSTYMLPVACRFYRNPIHWSAGLRENLMKLWNCGAGEKDSCSLGSGLRQAEAKQDLSAGGEIQPSDRHMPAPDSIAKTSNNPSTPHCVLADPSGHLAALSYPGKWLRRGADINLAQTWTQINHSSGM